MMIAKLFDFCGNARLSPKTLYLAAERSNHELRDVPKGRKAEALEEKCLCFETRAPLDGGKHCRRQP
jgi:hypothetical protein